MVLGLALAVIVQIFALLNPLASFPYLTAAYEQKKNMKGIALKATLTAFITAVIIVFLGNSIMNMFGIDINSLRVAGGIILLILGIQMFMPKDESEKSKVGGINSMITIIATPLLTGPAVISYITIKSLEIGKSAVLINMTIAFLIVGIVFYLFAIGVNKINSTVVDIVSRIMGLFLCAVAIEMIAKGIESIIKISLIGSL